MSVEGADGGRGLSCLTFSWQFMHKLSISSTTLGSLSSLSSWLVDSAPFAAASPFPCWVLAVRVSAFLPILSKNVSKAAPSTLVSSCVFEAIFVVWLSMSAVVGCRGGVEIFFSSVVDKARLSLDISGANHADKNSMDLSPILT